MIKDGRWTLSKPIPRHLYRYSPAEKQLDYLEDWVLRGQLWLSSKNDFNDPYDCLPVISLPTGEIARKAMLSRGRERARGMEESYEMKLEADKKFRQMRKWPRHKIEEHFFKTFNFVAGKIGIRCFAEEESSVLMWSHYASYHSGVCLRMNMEHWPHSDQRFIAPVQYHHERPKVGAPGTDEFFIQLIHALTQKAEGWSYEREWRLIVHDGARSLYELPKSLVDAVIVGAKASLETRRRVQLWQKSRPELLLFETKLCNKTFELEIQPFRKS